MSPPHKRITELRVTETEPVATDPVGQTAKHHVHSVFYHNVQLVLDADRAALQ